MEILDLRSPITKIKVLLERLSRFELMEERISEFEDGLIEIMQFKEKKKKKKRNEENEQILKKCRALLSAPTHM